MLLAATQRSSLIAGAVLSVFVGGCGNDVPVNQARTSLPEETNVQAAPNASVVCSDERFCREVAEAEAAGLRHAAHTAPRFTAEGCSTSGSSAPICHCGDGDLGTIALGPPTGQCYARGRAGECLWDGGFASCQPEAARNKDVGEGPEPDPLCPLACAELERRFADDRARVHDARVVHASCDGPRCRSVLRVDDRCYVGGTLPNGQAYDCTLDPLAILEQHERAQPEPDAHATELAHFPYLPGTQGFVTLEATDPSTLFVRAQFVEAQVGAEPVREVLDPLEGLDDCGIFRGLPSPDFPSLNFFRVDEAVLHDGDQDLSIPLGASSSIFASYDRQIARPPRYGERYGFTVRGAAFDPPLTVQIELPERFELLSLPSTGQLGSGGWPLRWSGSGAAPLRVSLRLAERLADSSRELYTIDCLLQDDGEHTLPASLFARFSSGFVHASFTRSWRSVQGDHAKLLTVGEVGAFHQLAFGASCDRTDVRDACLRYADHLIAESERCGGGAPTVDAICPAYLATACGGCAEFFECKTRNVACGANGMHENAVCACAP